MLSSTKFNEIPCQFRYLVLGLPISAHNGYNGYSDYICGHKISTKFPEDKIFPTITPS